MSTNSTDDVAVVTIKPGDKTLDGIREANRQMATRILSRIQTQDDAGARLMEALERLERPIQRLGMLNPTPLEQNEALTFALAMIVATTIARTLRSQPLFGDSYSLQLQIKNALEQTLAGVHGIGHVETAELEAAKTEAAAAPADAPKPEQPTGYSKKVLDEMPGFVAIPTGEVDADFVTLMRTGAGFIIDGVDTQKEVGLTLVMSLGRMQMLFAKAIAGGEIGQQESLEFCVHMLGASAIANLLEHEPVTFGNGSIEPRLEAWVDKILKRSYAFGRPTSTPPS